MFFHWICITFVFQGFQGLDYSEPCRGWMDDIVNVSSLSGNVGIGDGIVVFLFLFSEKLGRILGLAGLPAVEDLGCSFRTHHRNLRAWPGIIDIAPKVF